MIKREVRSLKAVELRATKADDGKQYLEGRAASYNVMSGDLGWFFERIIPGAFSRAVSEKQDVRHLINHNPSLVLGRTAAGTLELAESEAAGLTFRTLLPNTSYAADLVTLVERGDVNECSFGFIPVTTAWVEEPDPSNARSTIYVRELRDLDLFDISTVTFPAYPETNTELDSRSIPTDAPAEFRSRLQQRAAAKCACDCSACADGNCADCSDADCDDANCRCAERSAAWKSRAQLRLRMAQVL